jgi:hypothetical protein
LPLEEIVIASRFWLTRPQAALRGSSERLPPILMTALVMGLGLLPLAVGSGDPRCEIEGPMATVILGGLVTSTLLNLIVSQQSTLLWHSTLRSFAAYFAALSSHSVIGEMYLFSTVVPERTASISVWSPVASN